jgi:hypothetical protein
MSDEADVLYFDLVSTNFINTSYNNSPASYNQSRTIPYLTDPSLYYGAITQFTINNTSVPLFVPEIAINQSNVNLTVYTVSLAYGGFTVTEPIYFVQQDLLVPVPLPPSSYTDGAPFYNEGYYNIYNYNFFNSMVNTALSTAYANLQLLVPALPAVSSPTITYNATTQLFSINVPNNVFVDLGSAPFVEIYFNSALYFLYSFLPSQTTSLNNLAVEKLFIDANTGILDTTTNLRSVIQELPSINLWSPVSSIVITSSFLPVQKVLIATPQLYYNGTEYLVGNNNNSLTQPILIEYSVPDNIYSKTINYIPNAQYQFFDLNDAQPLYILDFKFWYRGKSSVLFPIFLNSGASCAVKIGFFKKDKFSHLKSIK